MAKELPYFKFEPGAWDNGNIQMCSREAKGLFIDLCSIYWSRLGELPYALALQKHCMGNADVLKELQDAQIFGVIDGQIIIEFLDEQLNEFQETSEKRRKAAQKRWSDASALQKQSKSNAIREEKKREEEIREEKLFNSFWDAYDKKVGKDKCFKLFLKLSEKDYLEIMQYLPDYIKRTQDKQFRKNPETFLRNRCWLDELPPLKQTQKPKSQNTSSGLWQ